jgi:hypothetical protein
MNNGNVPTANAPTSKPWGRTTCPALTDTLAPVRYFDTPHPLKSVSLAWLASRNAAALASHNVHRATVEKYKVLTTIAPPILITADGRILDGHHRVCVAFERGQTEIMAYVQPQPA